MIDPLLRKTTDFIKSLYPQESPVPLHAPRFGDKEKQYLLRCIDTTYVSYVGEFVTQFEHHVKDLTGAHHAVAMVNGTSALTIALQTAGVTAGDLVITQALTFVATANAISHAGGQSIFVDVELVTLGMSPDALDHYLGSHAEVRGGACRHRESGRRIAACVPMHTFGHPCRVDEIVRICRGYGVPVIEDSAESLGSYYRGKHTGTFGLAGIFSFNGNKPITTGGGGMLITDDASLADHARHLTTTAKRQHPWEFMHDMVGYNLRLPNLNAAIGCAQMERISEIIENKRETARKYADFFKSSGIRFIAEPDDARSNYWLNGVILDSRSARDRFLEYTNQHGIQTRPVWELMSRLPMYANCETAGLAASEFLADRIVSVPSSVRTT